MASDPRLVVTPPARRVVQLTSLEGQLITLRRGMMVLLTNTEREYDEYVLWTPTYFEGEHPFVGVVHRRAYWRSEMLGTIPTTVIAWPAGGVWVLCPDRGRPPSQEGP